MQSTLIHKQSIESLDDTASSEAAAVSLAAYVDVLYRDRDPETRAQQQARFEAITVHALDNCDNPRDRTLLQTVIGIHRWALWPTEPGSPLPEGLQTVEGRLGRLKLALSFPLDKQSAMETELRLCEDGSLDELFQDINDSRDRDAMDKAFVRHAGSTPLIRLLHEIEPELFTESLPLLDPFRDMHARQSAIRQTGVDPLVRLYSAVVDSSDYPSRLAAARKIYDRERLTDRDGWKKPPVDTQLGHEQVLGLQHRLLLRLGQLAGIELPTAEEGRQSENLGSIGPRLADTVARGYEDSRLVHALADDPFNRICTTLFRNPGAIKNWRGFIKEKAYLDAVDPHYSNGTFSLHAAGRLFSHPTGTGEGTRPTPRPTIFRRGSIQGLLSIKQPELRQGLTIHRYTKAENRTGTSIGEILAIPDPDYTGVNRRYRPDAEGVSEAMPTIYHSSEDVNVDVGAVVVTSERVPAEYCLVRFTTDNARLPEREPDKQQTDLLLLFKAGILEASRVPSVSGYNLIAWDPSARRAAFRRIEEDNPYDGDFLLLPEQTAALAATCHSIGMDSLADQIIGVSSLSVRQFVRMVQGNVYQRSLDPTIAKTDEKVFVDIKKFTDFRPLVDADGRLGVECTGAANVSGLLLKMVLGEQNVKFRSGLSVYTVAGVQISSAGHVQIEVRHNGRSFYIETGASYDQDTPALRNPDVSGQRAKASGREIASAIGALASDGEVVGHEVTIAADVIAKELYADIGKWLEFVQRYSGSQTRDIFMKRIAGLKREDPLRQTVALASTTTNLLDIMFNLNKSEGLWSTVSVNELLDETGSLTRFLSTIQDDSAGAVIALKRHGIDCQSYVKTNAIAWMLELTKRIESGWGQLMSDGSITNL